MPVHALRAAFRAGGDAVDSCLSRQDFTHSFGSCIFLHVFLVSSSCISPVHTRVSPFASTGTHGIPREVERLVTEVSRFYAVLNPRLLLGRFLSSPFPPFMLKYNTMQGEKSYRQTHTRCTFPVPGTDAPSSWFPPGTAHGSRRKTSWMLACSQPLRKGTGPSKPQLLPWEQGGGFSPAWTGVPSCLVTYTCLPHLLSPGNERWSSMAPKSEDPNPKPSSSR